MRFPKVMAARARRFEAPEPFVRIHREAPLAEFSVRDDVDAEILLALHHVFNGCGQCRLKRGFIETLPWSSAIIKSTSESGRGKLPTWVVRVRSVLVFIIFLSPSGNSMS